MSLESVRAFFAENAPDIPVLELDTRTATVAEAAEAHGVAPAQIAKTLSIRVGDQVALVVTRGDARLDNRKAKAVFGGKVRMLGLAHVEAATGHPVGGVAPDWWNVNGDLATAGVPGGETPEQLFYADVEPSLAADAAARLLPQSVKAFSDALTEVAWKTVATTYLITESDAIFPLPAQEALSARAGSTVRRLNTSHSPFLSQPAATADVIEEAALSAV